MVLVGIAKITSILLELDPNVHKSPLESKTSNIRGHLSLQKPADEKVRFLWLLQV